MIEHTIRQRWVGDGRLTGFIPEDRCYAGWEPDGVLPYCSITDEGDSSDMQTSSGTEIEEHMIRFNVFSSDLAEAHSIRLAIKKRFARGSFGPTDEYVMSARRSASTMIRDINGVWQLAADYMLKVRTKTVGLGI